MPFTLSASRRNAAVDDLTAGLAEGRHLILTAAAVLAEVPLGTSASSQIAPSQK